MANNKLYGYTPKMSNEKDGNRLDKHNPYEFRKGMDYELTAVGCMRLAESTPEEREKATENVLKNLDQHPSYYSALIQFETGMNHAGKIEGKNFKSWLKDHFEFSKMQPVMDETFKKTKKTNFKDDQMDKPGKYNKSDYTVPFKTAQLKETIKRALFDVLKEQDDLDVPDVDVDDDAAADKAATKTARKAKGGNRFDLEKEAIKDLLYRGKKGKNSEHTEEEPAPKSILFVKNQMLDLYRTKYKGKEGGVDDYKAELKKANQKFEEDIKKHVEKFGEGKDGKGLGNQVTKEKIFGESLPDTIKLLGARLKEIEKEEEQDVIAQTSERLEIAKGDMTRAQQIKLLEICRKHGVSLREGSMGIKMYYEIAKEAYLEGVANGLRL